VFLRVSLRCFPEPHPCVCFFKSESHLIPLLAEPAGPGWQSLAGMGAGSLSVRLVGRRDVGPSPLRCRRRRQTLAAHGLRVSGSDGARALQMGGIGHVGGCREAPYDTRESGSDGARALQMGGIGHVGGCREAPYDTRESGSDGARAAGG
jgi:hypothetical protein